MVDTITKQEGLEIKAMLNELLVLNRRIDNTLRDTYKNNKHITKLEAARILSITVGTIENYIADGIFIHNQDYIYDPIGKISFVESAIIRLVTEYGNGKNLRKARKALCGLEGFGWEKASA